MATLSEANYSLVLDCSLPQEQQLVSSEEQNSRPISQRNSSVDSDSIVLYQGNYSSKNGLDVPNQQDEERIGDFEVDMYTSSFQLGMFLRSFLISFLYSSGIGVLILFILRPSYSKYHQNYFHYSGNNFLVKSIGWVNFLYFMMQIIQRIVGETFDQLGFIERLIVILAISFTSAAVGAYCHKKLVVILRTIKLKEEILNMTRFMIGHFFLSDLSSKIEQFKTRRRREGALKEVIERETEDLLEDLDRYEKTCAIQTTISRLNIDISLYYISFFGKTPENLLRKLKERQDLALIEKGSWLVSEQKFAGHDLLRAITTFEEDIFDYKYCTKPNQYDDKKAYAYTLGVDLLLNKKHKMYVTFIIIGTIYTALLLYRAIPFAETLIGFFDKQNEKILSLDINFCFKVLIFFFVLLIDLIGLSISSLIFFGYLLPYLNIGLFFFQAFEIMSSKYFSGRAEGVDLNRKRKT